MAFHVKDTGCCGVVELVDISTLSTPQDIIEKTLRGLYDHTGGFKREKPFIYFTSVVNRHTSDHASNRIDDYGQALSDYIVAQKLGTVLNDLPVKKNWSGNPIKMWIWMPDYAVVRAQYTTLRPEPTIVPLDTRVVWNY